MLRASACGFGQFALAAMAGQHAMADTAGGEKLMARLSTLAPRVPHFPARARRVIFLFMWGGPSHVDLFDPKPRLNAEAGKPLLGKSVGSEREQLGNLLGSPFSFALPAFITISPPRGHGGVQNYGSAFLPAVHQGTAIGSAETPISQAVVSNLINARIDPNLQRRQLELIQSLSKKHLEKVTDDHGIEGLIDSYELAFRMQSTMPPIMDLADESKSTLDLYGVGSEPTDNFGRQCLLARKFAEQGVRYIQVSTNYTWDHHQKVQEGHVKESAKVDRPIAGLLADLAQRGLLDDTLVLWGAEFGRTPMAENGTGRNHHPQAFTMWMAGGGVRGGLTYGSTDDFGYHPIENPVHMHDLHATLLHAMGLDHERLTYRHAGRDFRLTDVYGNVMHDLLA